jgi:hypothetical protein
MSITVKNMKFLMEQLEQQGHGDLEVAVGYFAGDYWHTELAGALTDDYELATVTHSYYHNCDKVIEVDHPKEAPDEAKQVILIRAGHHMY